MSSSSSSSSSLSSHSHKRQRSDSSSSSSYPPRSKSPSSSTSSSFPPSRSNYHEKPNRPFPNNNNRNGNANQYDRKPHFPSSNNLHHNNNKFNKHKEENDMEMDENDEEEGEDNHNDNDRHRKPLQYKRNRQHQEDDDEEENDEEDDGANNEYDKYDNNTDNNDYDENDNDDEEDDSRHSKKYKSSSSSSVPPPRRGRHAPIEIPIHSVPSSLSSSHVNSNPLLIPSSGLSHSRYRGFDPRFSVSSANSNDPSHSIDAQLFDKRYGFINEMKVAELDALEKRTQKMKKTKSTILRTGKMVSDRVTDKIRRNELQIEKIKNQNRAKDEKGSRSEVVKQWKQNEMKMRKQGKSAFYLKKSHVKDMENTHKFLQMANITATSSTNNNNKSSSSGADSIANNADKIMKFIEKKKQQRAQKDIKSMPSKR